MLLCMKYVWKKIQKCKMCNSSYEMCFRRVRGRPSPWGRALTSVWVRMSRESSRGPFTNYSREFRAEGCAPRRRASSHPSLKSAPSSWRCVPPLLLGQCAWVLWDGRRYILTLTRWDKTKRQGDQPAVRQTGSDSVRTDGQEYGSWIMLAITSDIIAYHCNGGDG